MTGFHSTLSRRDFMKALGLTSAGAGAIAAATPVFNDLDDAISASPRINDRPWWIKERNFGDPTVDIDWSLVKRYAFQNARRTSPIQSTNPSEWTNTGATYLTDAEKAKERELLIAHSQNAFPGWEPGPKGIGDIRQTALKYASLFLAFSGWPSNIQSNGVNIPLKKLFMDAGGADMFDSWLGVQTAPTPEQMHTPKWQGTPEENLQMMKSVVRFYGGEDVGAIEIDDNVKKLFWTSTYDFGKRIEFEDIEQAYETKDKMVIPNSYKWILTWTMRQPFEQNRRGAGTSDSAASYLSYVRGPMANVQIKEFMRAIGYQGLSQDNQHCGSGATATLSGLGELSRASYVNHPKYGISLRIAWGIPTNLPLAVTKPIDFGGFEFCKTCGICAEQCPTGAIHKGDPSWETSTPGFPVKGFLGFHTDYSKCPHCPVCMSVCPFNTAPNGSFIHDFVKSTSANTTLLNGFFANMSRNMGYGRKDPRDWWEIEDMPWGVDTTF
ncbi:dehalogenase [Dehalococcoides mccartyi CG1]|uniref:reductive dehalogenase n=1 Tax=Dehalococcoides mccartyi TaxID=61435 RepID=UPI0004E0356D|nr:reductive dehalogenase [Dehalococcoides mccartyi]AII58446.1 dehalogenase [Dehalococcoides mccartyi CG1]